MTETPENCGYVGNPGRIQKLFAWIVKINTCAFILENIKHRVTKNLSAFRWIWSKQSGNKKCSQITLQNILPGKRKETGI